MPQTKPIVSIENVVASASVDQKIDLNEITRTFPDVEYHPDQFPGLVFRLKNPKLIYQHQACLLGIQLVLSIHIKKEAGL